MMLHLIFSEAALEHCSACLGMHDKLVLCFVCTDRTQLKLQGADAWTGESFEITPDELAAMLADPEVKVRSWY